MSSVHGLIYCEDMLVTAYSIIQLLSIKVHTLILYRQTSTINGHRLEQQQRDTLDSQHENIAVVNKGINANRYILNSHTDLILSLTRVMNNAATQEQNEDLRDIILKILKANVQIFDMVLNMQANLPQQVERQQPVLFLDAFNRLSPVHLEFITSAEAFVAVLKVRFQDAGLRKIERGQYSLEEACSNRKIDLQRPWHTCFLQAKKST